MTDFHVEGVGAYDSWLEAKNAAIESGCDVVNIVDVDGRIRRAAITPGVLTFEDFLHARESLFAQSSPKFSDGHYRMTVHPETLKKLRSERTPRLVRARGRWRLRFWNGWFGRYV